MLRSKRKNKISKRQWLIHLRREAQRGMLTMRTTSESIMFSHQPSLASKKESHSQERRMLSFKIILSVPHLRSTSHLLSTSTHSPDSTRYTTLLNNLQGTSWREAKASWVATGETFANRIWTSSRSKTWTRSTNRFKIWESPNHYPTSSKIIAKASLHLPEDTLPSKILKLWIMSWTNSWPSPREPSQTRTALTWSRNTWT